MGAKLKQKVVDGQLVNYFDEPVLEDEWEWEDQVNSPSHYTEGTIETIDYIEDVLGKYHAIHHCHGTVLKYLGSRLWNKANPLQDAKKARWYLDRMIKNMEETKGENW